MGKFKKALLIVDNDFTTNDIVFTQALAMTAFTDAQLDIICVLPDLSPLHYSTSNEAIEQIKRSVIDAAVARINASMESMSNKPKCSVSVVTGKLYIEAIKAVIKDDYDLLIKQAENPSWLQSLFGSDDVNLLRKCPCALWLVNEEAKYPFKDVVAAIDFSDDDEEQELGFRIARQAASFSFPHKAQVHILNAYDASVSGYASYWSNNPRKFEKTFLSEEARRRQFSSNYLVQQLKEEDVDLGLQIEQHVVEGHPITVIPEKIKELDASLVVMGTIGRSGIKGMLIGNTAESILQQLSCSVLALKPSNFVCPITLD
jgi:nucleotide-binding universal stress UspA family protein